MSFSVLFEGPDGAGKTTQALALEFLFRSTTNFPILRVREPGGTQISEMIRNLLKSDPFEGAHPTTNMLLFSAARNEVLERLVFPFLKDNPTGLVIGDRSWPSTMAYQTSEGADGKYLGFVQRRFMNYPDLMLYVDIPAPETRIRTNTAGVYDWRDRSTVERLQQVRERYLDLVDKNHNRSVVLDGYADPFEISMKAYELTLRRIAQSRSVGREMKSEANRFLREVGKLDLSELKEKLIDGGMGETYENARKHIELRRTLGIPSQEQLREAMYGEWEERHLPWVNFRKERE